MHWTDYFIHLYHVGYRYFQVAGIGFILFYLLFRRRISYKKIQLKFPKNNDYVREILFSSISICIFAAVSMLLLSSPITPYTTLYKNIDDHGWVYFFAAFPIMAVMHDTYFYWMHRAIHHKKLFKLFHLVHHRSTNPSPWAAYAFHPLEAVLETGIFPIFMFTIPMHKLHFFLFFFFSIIYNVYGHLGFELYPKSFSKSRVGKWINTSVCHNQHHQYFKGNYGLYFLFWDRIMGTLRKDYDEQFAEVKGRAIVQPAISTVAQAPEEVTA